MDYWVHLQILLFCIIIGTGVSLFLGARSYIKIALVILLLYIPIQIYYAYKLSQALIPVIARLPEITIYQLSQSVINQAAKDIVNKISSSKTITADGTLITSPQTGKVPINTVMSNLGNTPTQVPMSTIPDYYPRKSEEGNRFATEKSIEDSKYSIFQNNGQGQTQGQGQEQTFYSADKPPFDGLNPNELLSRLNYIYYATAQPAKRINYNDFKTHADKLLDSDGTKLSNDDAKLQSYAAGHYPQLTVDQIDARDCLNYGSGPNSCFQSKQLFYNVANNFNILDKGVNMDNANLVVREDFSMPQNLEAIVSRPLPLDVPDRNAGIMFINAPKGNLDRPLDQESNESLGRKLDDSNAICRNCKLAVCRDDYCGLQNSLFM
jgi:hypothetical protein